MLESFFARGNRHALVSLDFQLYFDPGKILYIEGLPADESEAVIDELTEHMIQADGQYRHKWRKGDVVIWDNRSTQHYALFDFAGQRVVERVHVAGGPMRAHSLDLDGGSMAGVTDGPW